MKCNKCGNEMPQGAKFCKYCGAKAEKVQDADLCPSCGSRLENGARFCNNCGTDVLKFKSDTQNNMYKTPSDEVNNQITDNEERAADEAVNNSDASEETSENSISDTADNETANEENPAEKAQPAEEKEHNGNTEVCPHCGTALVPGALFCKGCGRRTDESENTSGDVCKKCGKPLKPNAAFCMGCGAPVENGAASAPSQNQVKQLEKTVKKKTNPAVIVLIVLLALILCGTATLGAYIIINPDSELAALITGNDTDYSEDDRDEDRDDDDKKDEDEDFDEDDEDLDDEDYYDDDYEDEYDDDYYDDEDDYLFPSDSEYITSDYLDGLTRDEVALVRNEIYARHGYVFQTEPFKTYFGNKDWYYPDESFSESDFNSIEKANKDFIVKYEKDKGWR